MTEIGYGVSSSGSLADALKAIPDELDAYVRSGFHQLAQLDPTIWPRLLDTVRASAPYPSQIELGPIAEAVGVDPEKAIVLTTAVRLLLGILAFRQESVDEVIRCAITANVLSQEDSFAVTNFVRNAQLTDRAGLKKSLLSSTLQHSVLPSLTTFDLTVDLRLDFDTTDSLTTVAPLAVVHLDTDSNDKEIWFQMSRVQIEALSAKLHRTLAQLKIAEGLALHLP